MGDVDPQAFGEMKGEIKSLSNALQEHLRDCLAANEKVAKNLNRLSIAFALLAGCVLGKEGLIHVIEKILG